MIPNLHIDGPEVAKLPDEELPDSRLSHHRTTICGPCGLMSRVFCINCGADGGLVTEAWAVRISYLCDDCFLTHGALPMPQVPDSVVRGENEWNALEELLSS